MSGQLLFDDEFDSFNAYSKSDAWRTAYHWGPGTVINGEKGYYVDTENAGTTGPAGAVNPFSVSNGALTITAGPATATLPTGQPYTSGVLSSMGSFEHQYGYYEIRADLPGGQGFWPAFWLMPADKVSPPELDIMEFSSKRPNEYATTAHSNAGGTYTMSQRFTQNLPDLTQGYHTYAVDWQADTTTWYFDDRPVYAITTPADFHKPMYILMNQAVGGGSWIGPPDGSTQTFNIDYVRVYDAKPGAAPPAPFSTTATGTTTTGATTSLSRIVDGVADTATAQAYAGPVSYLQWQYIGDGRGEVVGGSAGNDFLNLRGGDDAAAGGNGNDVLDGGSGSNWLIGGAGTDTFFVDGRNPEPTWSTITDLEPGEWTTLWGFREGGSRLTWEQMSGAEGYKGATVRCDIDGNGSIDTSVTFAGHAVSEMLTTASSVNGTPYLAFIKL